MADLVMGEEKPIQDALKPRVRPPVLLPRANVGRFIADHTHTHTHVVAVVACLVQEGWLDVKQGDTWTKHWCLVTEMRQIKEKLESHAGQTAAGSYDLLPPIIPLSHSFSLVSRSTNALRLCGFAHALAPPHHRTRTQRRRGR